MRPRRALNDQVQLARTVADLASRFEYPEPTPIQFDVPLGAGGGMLTVSVAGSSVPPEVAEKADFTIDDLNPADGALQTILDLCAGAGGGTVWLNAFPELTTGLSVPGGVTLRGLSPASTGFVGPPSGPPAVISVGVGSELRDLSLAFDVRIINAGGHVDNIWAFGVDASVNGMITVIDAGSRVTNILASGCDAAGGIVHVDGTSNVFVDHIYTVNNGQGPVVGLTDVAYVVVSHLLDISSSQLVHIVNGFVVALSTMAGLAEGTVTTGAINVVDSEAVSIEAVTLDSPFSGVRIQNSQRVDVGSTVGLNIPNRHGVWLVDASDCTISARVTAASQETHNTWDNVHIEGSSNKNFVTGMHLNPLGSAQARFPRYGVNVAGGDCNRIVGNVFGNPADYGTDAYIDAGISTQTVWPNDISYGDNFTNCGES